MRKRKYHKVLEDDRKILGLSRKEFSLFFLGIGLTMFILNITTMLNTLPFYVQLINVVEYPFLGFYVSTLSSIFLIGYTLLNLSSEED